MNVILDGNEMRSKILTHQYIKLSLNLPDYYGNNLDALWDLLSSYDNRTHITLINKDKLIENLGEYGYSLLEVLTDVKLYNNNIIIEIK